MAALENLREQQPPGLIGLEGGTFPNNEGFILEDLPLGDFGAPIPFETYNGTGEIAKAKVEWEFRVPEELKRESPVIIAHGYFAKEGVYDRVADELASQGIAVATYNAVRKQRLGADFHPKHLLHPDRLVNQAPWAVIRDIQQRDDIEVPTDKFTFAGHSMGGRTAVMNALQHPNDVDGVIMIDAAGLEDHNARQMAARLPVFGRKEVRPALASRDTPERARIALNSLRYFINGPRRTVAEGLSIGNADIKPAIGRLKDHDIPSAILLSPADTLVYAENVIEHADGVADSISVMHDPNLGHLGPLTAPEKYGSAVMQLLQHFDTRNAVRQPSLALVA